MPRTDSMNFGLQMFWTGNATQRAWTFFFWGCTRLPFFLGSLGGELWFFPHRESNEEEGHQPMLFRHALWSPNKSIPKNVPKNAHAAPKEKRSTKRSRWFHRKYRPSWCLEGSKGAAASFLSTYHSRVFNKIPFDAFRLPNACFEEKSYLWFRFTTPLTVGKSFVYFQNYRPIIHLHWNFGRFYRSNILYRHMICASHILYTNIDCFVHVLFYLCI